MKIMIFYTSSHPRKPRLEFEVCSAAKELVGWFLIGCEIGHLDSTM